MADIITAAPGNSPSGRRRKKLSTKVDLTPMVDLGFLLITFFVFNSKMSEPKATVLNMPKDSNDSMQLAQTGALTVFPINDREVFFYHGDLTKAIAANAFGYTNYSTGNGLGKVIRDKQALMENQKPHSRNDLMLLIKPLEESNYGRIIDIMDEIKINDVRKYALVDISDEEKKLLKEQLTH